MEHLDVYASIRSRCEDSRCLEMVLGVLLAAQGGQRYRKQCTGSLQHYDPSGLEGDGPLDAANSRFRVQLATDFGYTPATTQRQHMLLHRFHAWLLRELSVSLAIL